MAVKKKVAKKVSDIFLPPGKTPITPDKPGLATASRIAKKDAEIRKFAATHGKAAAIKKYGKDRVDQVPMSTKKIGKPPSKSKAGEGPHGISGQPMTGKPSLIAQDKYPSDISGTSPTNIPATRYGQRGKGGIKWSTKKHGGKITYKMTGGQVVDAGYD